MKRIWSALSFLSLGALVIGGTIYLWKLNHREVWPPIDRTARYSYCQLEDQVYLKVVDHNAYVILESGGPHLMFESMVIRKEAMKRPFSDPDAFREALMNPSNNYDLSKPDLEFAIPLKEDPYRWRPVGRESMHDLYSRMKRDGSYEAKMWEPRLH